MNSCPLEDYIILPSVTSGILFIMYVQTQMGKIWARSHATQPSHKVHPASFGFSNISRRLSCHYSACDVLFPSMVIDDWWKIINILVVWEVKYHKVLKYINASWSWFWARLNCGLPPLSLVHSADVKHEHHLLQFFILGIFFGTSHWLKEWILLCRRWQCN